MSEELRRQLPGLEGLVRFFRAAGVGVEFKPGRWLWINGVQAEQLTHLPPPETLEWNSIVSGITLRYLRGKFFRAVADNARFDPGLRIVYAPRERGFAVVRGEVRLAVIHPARAQIPQREAMRANFLIPGEHWRILADVLHDTEGELVAEWKRQEEDLATTAAVEVETQAKLAREVPRQFDHLPDGLGPALVDACLVASRRIRLARQVAYDRPVILESEVADLTLLPVKRNGPRLLMPFRHSRNAGTVTGELIVGDRDPLPLLVTQGVADEDAITAWTCALLGVADATCIDFEELGPRTPRVSAIPHPRAPSSAPRPSAGRALPRRRQWPSYLQPSGGWVHYGGSFVAGHRRRLQDGQMASGLLALPANPVRRSLAEGVAARVPFRKDAMER